MTFDTPPPVSLLTAALKRTGDLSLGVPTLEASARRLELDAEAYAKLCGFSKADPLPLTYLDLPLRGLQFAVLTNPKWPLRIMGLVHVRQRIERTRHIGAHEVLSATLKAGGHRVVRRGGEVDLEASIRAGEEVVWRGTSTLLSTSLPGDGVRREPPPEVVFPVDRADSWVMPADLGRRYAAVSLDYNPIHLTALTAKLFGFPRALVHGWWTFAHALAVLGEQVPAACVVDVAFRKPIFLPAQVRFEAGKLGAVTHFRVTNGSEISLSGSVSPRPA